MFVRQNSGLNCHSVVVHEREPTTETQRHREFKRWKTPAFY